MRKGDTVRISYEGVVEEIRSDCIKFTTGIYYRNNKATIEVVKPKVVEIGDVGSYRGDRAVVAAIVDGFLILRVAGYKTPVVLNPVDFI